MMMDKIEEVLDILLLVACKQLEWCTDAISASPLALDRTYFRGFACQICQLFDEPTSPMFLDRDGQWKLKRKDKPTYRRAAIEDWKGRFISLERLCEIWRVSLYATFNALLSEAVREGEWLDIPTERIEEILEGLK